MRKCCWTLIACLLTVMTACGDKDNAMTVDYYPVRLDADGPWSFVDKDGNIFLEDEFDYEPSAVVNNLFTVPRDSGRVALYRFDDKNPVLVADSLLYAGISVNALIPVTSPDSRIKILNHDGDTKFTLMPVNGKEITACDLCFSDGMLIVRDGAGMLGFYNEDGKVAVAPAYHRVSAFGDGLAVVGIEKDNVFTFTCIDRKGNEVFRLPRNYEPYSAKFSNGRFFLKDGDGRICWVDKKGQISRCPAKVHEVSSYHGDIYAFRNKADGWGVMNFNGETLIRPRYESAYVLSDGRILVTDSDEAQVYSADGQMLFKLDDYNRVSALNPPFGFAGFDKKTVQLYAPDGRILLNAEFAGLSLALASSNIVLSDYFDLKALTASVVGAMSADGMHGARFGQKAADILKGQDVENHIYNAGAELPGSGYDGPGFNVRTMAFFSDYISFMDETKPAQPNGNYIFNPEAHLLYFDVVIRTAKDLKTKAFTAMYNALEADGFKVIKQTGADSEWPSVLMRKGDVLAFVNCWKGDGKELNVKYMQATPDFIETYGTQVDVADGKVELADDEYDW